jgi:hypothetical protein
MVISIGGVAIAMVVFGGNRRSSMAATDLHLMDNS